MLAALEMMRDEYDAGFTFEVVDVDADPLLLLRYDERVPVLVVSGTDRSGKPLELCQYFLDAGVVREHLAESGLESRIRTPDASREAIPERAGIVTKTN